MGKDSTYIYFDGSCSENRNVGPETPAGWGFCVIIGDNGIGTVSYTHLTLPTSHNV